MNELIKTDTMAVTLQQAASRYGRCVATIRRWSRAKPDMVLKLPGVRTHRILLDEAKLEAFVGTEGERWEKFSLQRKIRGLETRRENLLDMVRAIEATLKKERAALEGLKQ